MSYRKPSKYRAVPTVENGIRFDSKREAMRYQELRLLELAGQIHRLRLQPVFLLDAVGGQNVGRYVADFVYCTCADGLKCGRNGPHVVYEDVKGIDTPLSKWKRKHVEAQYGIQVRLV